jgi:hypothetical protein
MKTRIISGALLAFGVLVTPIAVAQNSYGQPQFTPPLNPFIRSRIPRPITTRRQTTAKRRHTAKPRLISQ